MFVYFSLLPFNMPRQNGQNFADIFKCIDFKEILDILLAILLSKFILQGQINHKSALVQVKAWCGQQQTSTWTCDDPVCKRMYIYMYMYMCLPASVGQPIYPQTSNISLTLVGNKIVDHPDVVDRPSVLLQLPGTSAF